ncbi:hypothetical protein ACJMK2_013853 [Sinanodonta woodiana]|uniref:non-specific serine/threonine protein kinase n=2 Tax=Sinanodonta woodiana TaxID=1069815 RepID=A0ABD3UYS4_SINWO
MATGGQTENVCSLINVEGMTLQDSSERPWYTGIVVVSNKIFVIDGFYNKVRIHGLQDGRLLHESDRLDPSPTAVCLVNVSEIAVLLDNGLIKIMSTHDTPVIRWSRDLRVRGGLDRYHGVVSFKGDLVVCGVKNSTMCWCMVSSNDGRVVGTIHQICKVKSWSLSSITAKHNIIYISCRVYSPDNNNGVYAYDVQDPRKYKYIYKHKDLKLPKGIAVDRHGSLFVCNSYRPYNCIHHLTSECRLVSIITQGIPRDPRAICCDDGHLYITSWESNVTSSDSNHITIYRTQYPVIPSEVLNMEPGSIEIYRKALSNGKEKVYNIRIMVVGPYDVGKTTLTKRLLGKDVNICDRQSTEGICIQTECCTVSLATREWITQEQNAEQYLRLQWLVKLFNEQVQHKSSDKEQMPKEIHTHVITENQDNIPAHHDVSAKTNHDIDENIMPTLSQPVESPIAISIPESSSYIARENEKKDAVMEIIQLVNANSDKLVKSMEEYAKVGMWDFAGQYVFYTTHQTFLSYRAIYLLVIDLSQQITALIQDECFIDTAGLKLCQVQETIDTWMNLIHSCTPSPQSGIPAVILVGTHLDKIPERYRHEVCEKYFTEIRSYLSDKPTILHLVNEDFAIDNTVVDIKLVALKQKIVQVASQQPYWGEEVPARWILLETELTRLKAAGIKVIHRTLLEAFNQAENVPIPTEELDLFLKFQNDIGMILYFSIEILKDKIVLVPQWMIDAVKSLITAKTFVLRNAPAVANKWDMFNKSGKLYPELIDAIWTKETYPDLHDNKEHILLLMEHLNIIARPRCFSEDGSEIKVEYFLAPCMLKEKTPENVMFPKPDPEMKSSSSVLCYNFVDKFLPYPIFHRLLATCVSQWPIAQTKLENQIFCGCCIFSLDLHHRLTVLFREYIIFVQVFRFGATEMTPSSKLCITVQEFITKTLTSIIGYLGHSLKFEMSVQCPKSVGYRLDCLIPLADLLGNVDVPCHFHDVHAIRSQDVLKFWFQEEEPSDAGSSADAMPSPPTSDTDRFMCIAYLLVDVGSRVLRQLLRHHTVTATSTLDQYLAKNKSTIQSLRRVFNQSQMDIMFPPNGDDTNLDDYDITLLSALFQNIVPTLSQQEKDMIKRLREERNKLYGHAKSCQIGANDFQTYWNGISSTLTTLSQQCGNTAFEAKILQEIQRTKVSAIPAGSYLGILTTWFDLIESFKDELQDVTARVQALELNTKPSSSES